MSIDQPAPLLSVDECWAFLESYLSANRSGGIALLPLGISPDLIAQAEAAMGVELPHDMQRFYSRHNGSGVFSISPYKIGGGAQRFLALGDIIELWETMVRIGTDFERDGDRGMQKGPIKDNYWNRNWIPFMDNQGGDNIFVDLDPADGGTVGQIVDWWHEGAVSTYLASSLCEWINEVVEQIRKGVYAFHET